MPVAEADLTLTLLHQQYQVSGSRLETIAQCFDCHSISVFVFNFTNVCMYVFSNTECTFSVKFFSFGSLSLLTNFQKLYKVWSNAFNIILHIFFMMFCLF